jgi:hypothetical protein
VGLYLRTTLQSRQCPSGLRDMGRNAPPQLRKGKWVGMPLRMARDARRRCACGTAPQGCSAIVGMPSRVARNVVDTPQACHKGVGMPLRDVIHLWEFPQDSIEFAQIPLRIPHHPRWQVLATMTTAGLQVPLVRSQTKSATLAMVVCTRKKGKGTQKKGGKRTSIFVDRPMEMLQREGHLTI